MGRVGIEPTTLGLRVVPLEINLAWLSQIGASYVSRNYLRFAYLGTYSGHGFAAAGEEPKLRHTRRLQLRLRLAEAVEELRGIEHSDIRELRL